MADPKLSVRMMQTPLARARGAGAARSGVGHWRAQRFTAIALVPLALWFVFSVLALEHGSRADVAHWMSHPVNTVLLITLMVALFHHMQLGLQVVIEDYVHADGARLIAMLLMKGITILLALAAVISILKLGF
ncbi:MAG TPA: succinate dehydrogenase, hydrophobic membrane anchor protein [Acetobacteraceae bacterium]|nr:succinate dehydrogenase, hydrophobic membrane anchor protein [Acetobacteraceae bacterium]